MDTRPIGVFDSGVGGLSVVRQLHALLPHESIVYFGDTGRVPYGTRSPQVIRQYAAQVMAFLQRQGVKLLVAACGTVSSNLTEEAIAALPIPYTGVIEPTAQAACVATQNKVIGVVGTGATVHSGAFDRAIAAQLLDAQVVSNPCPLLVPVVEDGRTGEMDPVASLLVEEYLAPIRQAGADTLILGCTHFPLLYRLFDRLLEGKVRLIDPGISTAQRVRELLEEHDLATSAQGEGTLQFFVSDQPAGFVHTAEAFLGRSIGDQVRTVSLEELTAN